MSPSCSSVLQTPADGGSIMLVTPAPPLAAERSAISNAEVPGRLGLWDTVGMIVGIVVGTAIFVSPPLVFQNASGPWQAMGIWLLGVALSLCGALCYAELATTYPRLGGDYIRARWQP